MVCRQRAMQTFFLAIGLTVQTVAAVLKSQLGATFTNASQLPKHSGTQECQLHFRLHVRVTLGLQNMRMFQVRCSPESEKVERPLMAFFFFFLTQHTCSLKKKNTCILSPNLIMFISY